MTTKHQPGVRVSEYVLEECVGAGTFGEVWRARHHIWEKDRVAVKLPTEPEYVRYLQREGVVVHGLKHPNIIRVIGLDPYAEIPYLVMELVEGPSLRAVLDEHRQGLPINTAVVVLRGMLRAMARRTTPALCIAISSRGMCCCTWRGGRWRRCAWTTSKWAILGWA